MQPIEYDNILYVSGINKIGGVETYIYELAKKYYKYDIAVVYKTADQIQLNRLKEYVPCIQHHGQRLLCKTLIMNYDIDILNYVDSGTVYLTLHSDYFNSKVSCIIPKHKKIDYYIAITKHLYNSMKAAGIDNVIFSFNPISVPKEKKPLILMSATRLTPDKGSNRMKALANALDRHGINYVWYVFTNSIDDINNSNVIFLKPRLDVTSFMSIADYIVQLSDSEALCYTVAESLFRSIPVIVTPIPSFVEMGFKDKETGYYLDFDLSNIDEVCNNILTIPKFTIDRYTDKYNLILTKGKSKYLEDLNTFVDVICTGSYYDIALDRDVMDNEVIKVNKVRAEELVSAKVCKYLDKG